MAVLLAVLFVGHHVPGRELAAIRRVELSGEVEQTVIAQVAAAVFGDGRSCFYLFQTFAALILFLAANTSFAAFPRLAAVLAEDGFFPRQFALPGRPAGVHDGHRRCWAWSRPSLVIVFGGDTHALIPLYAVGVFIDFTISQSGMVRHWLRDARPGLALPARDQRRRLRG